MTARSRRKIIAYLAMSADGYIARPDGDVKWLDRPKGSGDYGMSDFFQTIDTVILGRKTYELGLSWGQTSYPGKKNYVFTRSSPASVKNIEFVTENVAGFAERMKKEKGKDIWLVGGADLNGSFLDAGAIDEFIIHVIPTLIGDGIPLIPRQHRHVELDLLSSHAYSDGVVRLHYRVGAPARRSAKRKKVSKKARTSRQRALK